MRAEWPAGCGRLRENGRAPSVSSSSLPAHEEDKRHFVSIGVLAVFPDLPLEEGKTKTSTPNPGSFETSYPSSQNLHIPLLDQTLNIAFTHEKLAVLGEVQTSILGLNLPRVAQHPHIDENVLRRLQAARQVDVGPLPLVLRQQLTVLVHVLLLFGREGGSSVVGRTGTRSRSRPRTENILPIPDHLLEFVRAGAVVGQQAAFVATHAEVVDHQRTGGGGVFGWVEGGFDLCAVATVDVAGLCGGGRVAVVREDEGVLFVQVSHFFCDGLDGYAGVWGQVGQVLGAFGVGDQFGGLLAVHCSLRAMAVRVPFGDVCFSFFLLFPFLGLFVRYLFGNTEVARLERVRRRCQDPCLSSQRQHSLALPPST